MTLTQNYPQLKKIPQWLTTLLVILLGITLAKLLWMFLTPAESIAVQTPINPSGVIAKPKKQVNYGKIIADQHLFGKVEKKAVAVTIPTKIDTPPPVAAAPKLNIKLHGIMSYSKKKALGYALLSFNGKPQKAYAVNDSLDEDNKITVSDVTKEKVVISNHGKLEEFFLPRATVSKSGAAIPTNAMLNHGIAPPKTPMMATPHLSPTIPFTPKAGIQKPNKANAPSIKNMAKFREEIMADPAKLMQVATAEPFSKDGAFIGFRVRPGKQRHFFRQLGLRNGDVVKEVNGILMDSAEKGLMLMSEISGASDLNITVLRGTRDVQLPTLHF